MPGRPKPRLLRREAKETGAQELDQRHADLQARVRNSQDLVFVRFLLGRARAVGHGWVNGSRDPSTTSTRGELTPRVTTGPRRRRSAGLRTRRGSSSRIPTTPTAPPARDGPRRGAPARVELAKRGTASTLALPEESIQASMPGFLDALSEASKREREALAR